MIHAVIPAGKSIGTQRDPLLEYVSAQGTGEVENKVLIPIAGREMIHYVAEAVAGSSRVGRMAIVGLSPEEFGFTGPVEYVPARGGIFDNIAAGIDHLLADTDAFPGQEDPAATLILVVSADMPLLTTEMVDYFIDACLPVDADIYYSVVERSVMEGRFPDAGRTFVRLRDGSFAGGDLLMLRPSVIQTNRQLYRELSASRKSAWQMVRLLGLGMIVRFLTRSLTVAQAEKKVSQTLGCRGKAIISPYAELGMDVDKPHQLDMVCRLLGGEDR
jgi:GTP:adenosylcobinamide-phosphate guanylyltransferase